MSKIKCRFYTIADWLEEENWLREQHKNGLKLRKTVAPCFYVFDECEKEDVIYKLDYKNRKADESYKQMYKDYGWEYFNSCVGWNYFRKSASEIHEENEGELFSDNETKLSMLEKIIRTRLMPLVVIFLCCIVPNIERMGDAVHRSVGECIIYAVFLVLFFLYMWLFLHCGRKLRRMEKSLES